MYTLIWTLLGSLSLIFLIFVRINVHFSATFDAEVGAFCALFIQSKLVKFKIKVTFAMLKQDRYKILYYRLGKGKIRKIKNKEIIQKLVNKVDFTKKSRRKIPLDKLINLNQIKLTLLLGMQDASKLALTCGAFKIVFENVFKTIAQKYQVFAHPAFNSSGILINMEGILTLKTENIIIKTLSKQAKNKRQKIEKEGDHVGLSPSD